MRSVRLSGIFLALAAAVAACGGSQAVEVAEPAPTTSVPASVAETAATPESTSDSQPETTVPETTVLLVEPDLVSLVGGGQLDLNSIEGTDTVLWFWAPW